MASIVPPPGAPGDRPPPRENQGQPDTRAPVVVAGAGPVGLCVALALARCGVPSLVLEVEPARDATYFRDTGSKAICFQRDVLDAFDRLGVAAPLVSEGTTWTTARTYYREHEVRTVTFPGGTSGTGALPPWINISQARVEQELVRRAEAEPLVTLRYAHRVTGLRQDEHGVTVTVAGPDGATTTVGGTHLVGADGPRSTVRHLLGVEFPGESFADQFLICDIRAELPFPNERRFFFDPEWNPGRQVLVHQCPDSTWRIDWQVPEDYDLAAERASGALDGRIRRIVGDRRYEVVWSSVYRFHERCADRFAVGRVFLTGDAAHLYAPFGARGLNSGVQDAENLGWKLAVARASADPAVAAALHASYHEERWAAAQENLRVTRDTMRFLVPHGEAERRRRHETLQRAVVDPEARDRIDSGTLAEPYAYPWSSLTTPPASPPGPRGAHPRDAPPPSPRPGAICPDGPCRLAGRPEVSRMRQVLGSGFTVLAARADHARTLAGAASGLGLPVAARGVDDIETADPTLAEALPDAGTVWVLRPDAHLCAVLSDDDTGAVVDALRRACGRAVRATPRVQAP